jgi:pimeloyl-ACP methyl ester carboxylesterase
MPMVQAGDLQVHFEERGEGTPVILIHGNWSTCSWWEPTLDRTPPGTRTIAYDLRGRGGTLGPDSSYTIPSLAEDLGRFADALGLERFHLVGHSLGSAIAMEYAREAPDRVLSLTAVSPSWIDGMPAKFRVPAHQAALKASRDVLAQALRPLAPLGPFGPFWERLVDEGHAQRLEAAVANLEALTAWAPGDALSGLPMRATVICGSRDLLVGAETPVRVASVLSAPRVELPGVGHCAPIEAPDAFAAALWKAVGVAA